MLFTKNDVKKGGNWINNLAWFYEILSERDYYKFFATPGRIVAKWLYLIILNKISKFLKQKNKNNLNKNF